MPKSGDYLHISRIVLHLTIIFAFEGKCYAVVCLIQIVDVECIEVISEDQVAHDR